MSDSKGLQINWLGASGSALGAVTSAVLLSTLGAAGTLIGAALGSLIITVGGSVYAYSLQRAKSGLEKTAGRVKESTQRIGKSDGRAAQEPISATSDRRMADHSRSAEADDVENVTSTPEEKPSWQQTLRSMPWKRIAALAGGLFVLTMVIVFVFELSTGRPVSSFTGGTSRDSTGTTFSGLTNRGTEDSPGTQTPEEQQPAPDQDQDVEQEQPQKESPEFQDDPAPEEVPVTAEAPQPQPEEPAPQLEDAPEAPAE